MNRTTSGILKKCIRRTGNLFNMIKISIDEGSAFDILSIFEVKIEKSDTDVKKQRNKDNFKFLYDEICCQLGEEMTQCILNSDEYSQLVNENRKTFDVVDKAKTDDCLASDVDRANYGRYLSKGKLQMKFFNRTLTETKTGYEKLK